MASSESLTFTAFPSEDFRSSPYSNGALNQVCLVTSFGANSIKTTAPVVGKHSGLVVENPGLTFKVHVTGLVEMVTPCCWNRFGGGAKWRICSSCKTYLFRAPELQTKMRDNAKPSRFFGRVEPTVLQWCEALADPLTAALSSSEVTQEIERHLKILVLDRDRREKEALQEKKEKREASKAAKDAKLRRQFSEELAVLFEEHNVDGKALKLLKSYGGL